MRIVDQLRALRMASDPAGKGYLCQPPIITDGTEAAAAIDRIVAEATTPTPPIKGDEREMLEALAATLARLPDDTPGEARLYLDLTHGDGRLLRGTLDTILRHRTDTTDAGEVERIRAAARAMLPRNVCLTNDRWPDNTVVPLETTLGELRALSAALTPSPEARETGA